MADFLMHWNCGRCWRKWDVCFVIQGLLDREEYGTLEHCCEACAGRTPGEIQALRRAHKKQNARPEVSR